VFIGAAALCLGLVLIAALPIATMGYRDRSQITDEVYGFLRDYVSGNRVP
jgi:hypothetical protein